MQAIQGPHAEMAKDRGKNESFILIFWREEDMLTCLVHASSCESQGHTQCEANGLVR